ncbi:hypothetical protein CEQ90_01205 [Lewinellaceae bacterium SD302]|nr:hypothetical protein CEQ90_01205 [Lewinellaceae bacterium SD302]
MQNFDCKPGSWASGPIYSLIQCKRLLVSRLQISKVFPLPHSGRKSSTLVFLLLLLCVTLTACQQDVSESSKVNLPEWDGETRFEPLGPEQSGVTFANDLAFNEDFNIYTYRNYYNGGGVAMGDVNNDGLTDLYFSGNLVDNELYLNQGDLDFKVATLEAGVAGKGGWSTGVSMADVNGDGWLDIYVCNSGELDGDNKQNELFINNQDGTFTEAAEAWGIADRGYGTHGVFFDYDKDGDLDLYLLNNSYQAIGSFNLQKNERPKRDPVGGDKLFRNETIGTGSSTFTDVSEEAGIYGSVIGFGLGVTVGDVDRDGWQDIFVSNDFFERDYLYINQQDGTFKEVLTDRMKSISAASMGADMADINNDGYAEIFVTEMLPRTNQRIKTATTFENWNRYQYNLQNDYYHQFTRNMLHRNNGDGTFSDIGRMSGVEATDWSWGALIFDMDNDGNKDLFVANGIYQDLTNRDFLDFLGASETKKAITKGGKVDFQALVDAIPSNPVPNYAFRNRGEADGHVFEDVSATFGLDFEWFSNGSAYGDLDNDGDLDLVLNNTNAPALIYRNRTNEMEANNWLQIKLQGTEKNTSAIGSQVTVFTEDGKTQFLEMMPMRGFESTVDEKLHFGLGKGAKIREVRILWPDGVTSSYRDLAINRLHELSLADRPQAETPVIESDGLATLLVRKEVENYGIDFVHAENRFSDFDREPLTFHMLSAESPKLCKGDFNNDGHPDFYVGGARNQAGGLYLYNRGSYLRIEDKMFSDAAKSEDAHCACFDADGDGDLDLYVASGSSEFNGSSTQLLDRIYLNEGGGRKWRKSPQLLPNPSKPVISSAVAPHDVDGDGDVDLFVGSRMVPGVYGGKPDSYLLLNDGSGKFEAVKSPTLEKLGMVTDAVWADLNHDGRFELIVVGEWQSPKIYNYTDGELRASEIELPAGLEGWYNSIEIGDLNGDEYPDLVLGNHGLNSRFRAGGEESVSLYLNDFDGNGRAEPVFVRRKDGVAYTESLLHDLNKQIPGLRKKYLKYESFGNKTVEEIFPNLEQGSEVSTVNELRSLVILNDGKTLRVKPLPMEAQESPIYATAIADVDGDGDQDLITGGNFYYAKPQVGRYDADRGNLLLNDGQGNFSAATGFAGLGIDGEVRDLTCLDLPHGKYLLVARNNAKMMLYRIEQ